MNLLVIANWGLGLELLNSLFLHPETTVLEVITRFTPSCSDPWKNAVFERASSRPGVRVIPQSDITFEQMIRHIQELKIDLLVCHAFMKRLPESVFRAPRLGSVNIHPSLLPDFRGPSPTRDLLKQGASETGLTAHFMENEYDTGDIIAQTRIRVLPGDDVETVIERLKPTVDSLVRDVVDRLTDPLFTPVPQPKGVEIS